MKTLFQNVDISTIETKVSEEVALASEHFLDTKAISSPRKIKTGVWECVVEEHGIRYTTEFKFSGEKLKEYRCNCNRQVNEDLCSHLVAAIIRTRKELNKEEQITKLKRSRSPSKKGEIKSLVAHLPKEELENFIVHKSRTDKNFRLLFQSYFIESLPSSQLESFVDSSFSVLTKANEKVSLSKLNLYIELSKNLKLYFKSLIEKEDYTEAFRLSLFHLRKSFYIKHALHIEHTRFNKLHDDLVMNIVEAFQLIEAPEYRVLMLDHLEALLSSSYISANTEKERKLWLILYESKEKASALKNIANQFLSEFKTNDYDTLYFIKMISLLLQNDDVAETVVQSMSNQESYRIIHLLGLYNRVSKASQRLLLFYIQKQLNLPLSKYICEHIDFDTIDRQDFVSRSYHYFNLYKDSSFISLLLRIDPENASERINKTINSSSDVKFKAVSLLELDNTKQAVELLLANLSWPLISELDESLAQRDQRSCLLIYESFLREYVKNHFGRQAKEFVREVLHRLKNIGLGAESEQLQNRLRVEFTGRSF